MKEIWKDVVGYEGLYQVSNLGRVKSLSRLVRTVGGDGVPTVRRTQVRFLSPRGSRPFVDLWRGNQGEKKRVCRMVLEAFIGPCPEGMEACHFPCKNTRDNRLCNLRWDTRQANAMDRDTHGTMFRGEKQPNHVLTEENVLEARNLRQQGWTFKSLQKRYGCGFITIYKAVMRLTWSHV